MNKRLYIVLTVLSIIFLSIGGTFALITTSITATNITQIKSGNLTMIISGGGNQSVSFVPSKCTDENTIKRTITAKTTNTSGGKVSFSIGLNITELSDTYKKNTVRYALTTNALSCNVGIIAGGNFKDKTTGEDIWLVKNDYDNITQSGNTYTKTYYLYIWLDESETEYFDGSISVKLKGTTSNNPNLPITDNYNDGNGTNTLFYQIKSSADKYTRIDFSKTSEHDNTNGIYTTTNTDNGVPVYYYRGAVDNNHVIFANFCWRIVRTTETGGVKLIYDGVPSNGECSNTGEATTIGNSAFNLNYNSPAYVGYMYGATYVIKHKNTSTITNQIIFGNDILYDKNNDRYTLIDTYTLNVVNDWKSEYQTIASKYHYTCFSTSNTCRQTNYIHSTYTENNKNYTLYYFELSNGKNHLDILKEMLDNSGNTTDSAAKATIDTWYKNNMIKYTSQLEDTVFCNDRSYDTKISYSGFNKDFSNYNNFLRFNSVQRINYGQSSLICPNINDKFTVNLSNGNGKLTYNIGLLTADEIAYAGGKMSQDNTSYYLYNGITNWFFSPYFIGAPDVYEFYITNSGILRGTRIEYKYGLRPVLSLKQGTVLSSGSGTSTSPYIVE